MTVFENELTKMQRVSLRAILITLVRPAKNHNFTDLQKQVSTKDENTSTVSLRASKQASLDWTRMWRKTTVSANNEGPANIRRVMLLKKKEINPEQPSWSTKPSSATDWILVTTVLEWKETFEGSRSKTNIQSQVVKSMIGFGAVVKRVSVEADRCRTAAELLRRSCLLPEQAREGEHGRSPERAGRGGGSSRRQSVLAHCGIRGLNGDCRCRVTSCGRCYHGYFEISRSLDTASVCLTYCVIVWSVQITKTEAFEFSKNVSFWTGLLQQYLQQELYIYSHLKRTSKTF